MRADLAGSVGRDVRLRPEIGHHVAAAEFERDEMVHLVLAWLVGDAVSLIDCRLLVAGNSTHARTVARDADFLRRHAREDIARCQRWVRIEARRSGLPPAPAR